MSKYRSIDLSLSRIKPVGLKDPNGNIDSIELESMIYSSFCVDLPSRNTPTFNNPAGANVHNCPVLHR